MLRSAAVPTEVHRHLKEHLPRADGQEDLCFAVWHPSRGRKRLSALIKEETAPVEGERHVHGTASFESAYFLRAAEVARASGGGLAFLHSHPGGRSWQGMSGPDIETESAHAPRAAAITGLPLLGLTMAGDGALSGRFWERTERRTYQRVDCENVRVVGGRLQAGWNPHLRPAPAATEAQLRTVSAWGETVQADLARLRVGVIGAGSVGAMVAEALARSWVERILLLDFDTVEVRNLDRLIHTTMLDALLYRAKVRTLTSALERSASAAEPQIETLELSVVEESGFRAALDCDVLFSCVDRPWPRAALNYIALAHLIPVIDAGIHIKRKSDGELRMASWRAHVAAPGRRCLECLGQFNSGFVTVEKDGSLDDPSYIAALPTDHPLAARQNVFAFSQAAAAQAMEQYLRMVVAPGGLADAGAQRHQFKLGTTDLDGRGCERYLRLLRGDREWRVDVRAVQTDRPSPSRRRCPTRAGSESTAASGPPPRFVRSQSKRDLPAHRGKGGALTKERIAFPTALRRFRALLARSSRLGSHRSLSRSAEVGGDVRPGRLGLGSAAS